MLRFLSTSLIALGVVFFPARIGSDARAAAASSCPAPKTHSFPKSATGSVISFGVKGGSLRPWTVHLSPDGSTTGNGAGKASLTDGSAALKGILADADALAFFKLSKSVGCLGSGGNPDTSGRFISIKTSAGTKKVTAFGSCSATRKFDALWGVLENVAEAP